MTIIFSLTETMYWWSSIELYFLPITMSHCAHNVSQPYESRLFWERGSSYTFSNLNREKTSNGPSHACPFKIWEFPGFKLFFSNSPHIHFSQLILINMDSTPYVEEIIPLLTFDFLSICCIISFLDKITKNNGLQSGSESKEKTLNKPFWMKYFFDSKGRAELDLYNFIINANIIKDTKNVTFVVESKVGIIKIELDEARVNKIISGCLINDDNNNCSKCIQNNSVLMVLWFMRVHKFALR